MHWQPRHRVLFELAVAQYPFAAMRRSMRAVFTARFPQFSGYSFAGALHTLEHAGLIETSGAYVWATQPASYTHELLTKS